MLKKKHLLYLFASVFMNIGCAHFQNRMVRPFQEKISDRNISILSKTFETQPSRILIGTGKVLIHNHKNISLQKILSDSNSSFGAEYVKPIFSDDAVLLHFYETTEIKGIIKIEAKLKRNGFIKLKNTVTNCQGIPYLFGGCDQKKLRIGFTEKGQLIVQEAVSNTGALLFIFGTGYSYNAIYIFEEKS